MNTAFITHADCLKHEMADGHPESPARLGAISDQLIASNLMDYLRQFDAPLASIAQLERCHDRLYINEIMAASPREGLVNIDPDTSMNPHTVNAALRAAGSAVLATDLVLSGEVDNAFCSVRPPGHHAERHQAMGFCFFNNIAVGAAHALAQHGLDRVAILDFDVHYGNGTDNIFEQQPAVMVCSSYQHPLYPYNGRETIDGHLINTPLAAGTGSADFRAAIEATWLPQLHAFRPQMVFISAGFDTHAEEEMADLQLAEPDYVWLTKVAMDIADRYAKGRIVSVLEGGYSLQALGRSVAAHLRTLMAL